MKIAFLGWGQTKTGGNRVVFEHANYLIKQGHQVALFYHFGGQPDWVKLNTEIRFTTPFDNKEILETDYDFVVSTAWVCNYELQQLPLERVVNFFQSWDPYLYRFDDTKSQLALNAFKFKAVKMTVSAWLQNILWQEFQQQSYLVLNGIPFYEIQSHLKTNPKKCARKRIGVVSSTYAHFKDLDLAVEALELLSKRSREYEFYLVTEKDFCYSDVFNKFISKPNEKELYEIMQSFDVLLHTSVVEGFGLVPLEAMACGTPVVLTNSLGVLDYVTTENACLLNSRKASMLANAIEKNLQSPRLQEKLISAGYKTAEARDWTRLLPGIEEVYQKINQTNFRLGD